MRRFKIILYRIGEVLKYIFEKPETDVCPKTKKAHHLILKGERMYTVKTGARDYKCRDCGEEVTVIKDHTSYKEPKLHLPKICADCQISRSDTEPKSLLLLCAHAKHPKHVKMKPSSTCDCGGFKRKVIQA